MDARHVRRARARRRALGLVAVGTAAGVLGTASAATAKGPAVGNGSEQVTICHRTDSVKNPYEVITINASGLNGHEEHEIDKNHPWGDVIPASNALLANDCFPLAIEKSGNAEVVPGNAIMYSVTVTNIGNGSLDFDQIEVSDPRLPNLKLDGPPPDPFAAGATATWKGTRSVPLDLDLCGGAIQNTAKVTIREPAEQNEARRSERRLRKATQSPPSGRKDESTWVTQVVCPLNIGIAKTSVQTSVEPGGTVNYVVRVTNPGPLALPTAALTVDDPGATLTPPPIVPATLAPGESLDWAASKVAPSGVESCGSSVLNTASVTVTPIEDAPPPIPQSRAKRANGLASAWPYTSVPEGPVTGSAAPVLIAGDICPVVTAAGSPVVAFRPAGPALTVTKTGPARMLAGGRVAYRITVTNSGSANATDVTLRDQAPGVLTVASRPAGSTVRGRTIDWNLGTLVPGQSVNATVRFAARRTASGRACNVALASATGVDTARARACTTIVAARRPATPVTG